MAVRKTDAEGVPTGSAISRPTACRRRAYWPNGARVGGGEVVVIYNGG
jgi:hypothetical protein